MADKTLVSKQYALAFIDFVKGAVLAIGTPVIYLLQELIPKWDGHPLLKVALSALLAYLLKNLFEKPRVTTTYSSNEKAEEVAKKIESKQ